jgi:uncharacterized protein (DUF1697 family)
MSGYIAFLRAINVGGHTVKMETLRSLFETFGFSEVETFLASGNVIFESPEQDRTALESMIASGLQKALGYEVATFIRTGELRRTRPFHNQKWTQPRHTILPFCPARLTIRQNRN